MAQGIEVQRAPRLRSTFINQELVLLLVLVVLVVGLSQFSKEFLTANNLFAITRFFVEAGLIALPMTLIIITGGIDLSVGSMFGLSSVMLGFAWQFWGLPLPLGILVCLLVGVLAGLVNGVLIAKVKVPPLIVTLATLAIYRGLAFGISQARSVRGYPAWFEFWGQGYVGPIPTQFLILVVFAAVSAIFLQRTFWGRYIYALGSNETGARFSGIPVDRIKILLYTFSGLMCGLAGFIFTSRVTTTRADAGTGLELDVITAVVLGGASIYGGEGSIYGTALGLLAVYLLRNGLTLANIKGDATVTIVGAMLIVAVYLKRLITRK